MWRSLKLLQIWRNMILSQTVLTKITNQGAYYRSLGYAPELCKQGNSLLVKIEDLRPNSNINVLVRCDECSLEFSRPYQVLRRQGYPDMCYPCRRQKIGKTMDMTNIIHATKQRCGNKHPRWVENKTAFIEYSRKVRWLSENTYLRNKQVLNPNNHPRTRCGVNGGYQLDHIVSVKRAYELGWTVEQCSGIYNLQLLPWQLNNRKRNL